MKNNRKELTHKGKNVEMLIVTLSRKFVTRGCKFYARARIIMSGKLIRELYCKAKNCNMRSQVVTLGREF